MILSLSISRTAESKLAPLKKLMILASYTSSIKQFNKYVLTILHIQVSLLSPIVEQNKVRSLKELTGSRRTR